MRLIAGLAFLLWVTAAPSAQSKVVWNWGSDPAECELREEVAGTDYVLSVSRTPTDDETIVTLHDRAGKRIESSVRLQGVRATLTPGDTVSSDGYIGPGTKELRSRRTISLSLGGQDALSKFAAASSLLVAHQSFGEISIPIRAAPAAARAISLCQERKMREWGIDLAEWRALSRRPTPIGSMSDWLSTNDYPVTAEYFNVDGDVIARLTIGPDGAVQKCAGLNQGIYEGFNYSTCDALKHRAKFAPALDKQGRPTSAPFIFRVRFRMERMH